MGLSLNYNTPALVESGTAQKTAVKYGLTGYYYSDPTGNKTLPTNLTDPSRLLMVRSDNRLNFNWGSGAPSPGLPSNNFLVRWKGYITVPTATSYTMGTNADDGVRVKLGTGVGGADETVLNSWSNVSGNRWGTAKNLPANTPIPITVEYYEATGTAKFSLLIRGTGLAEQQVPVSWLAPNANILPDGWELGIGDGDVNYEKLQISSNSAVLSDSTGQKYEYTWKNNGYVPPKDMEAVLTRNDNNTYTVLDTDGTTYIFDAEGKLISVAAPEDDRQPGAIKYEYAGNPSRLVKVIDGVNPDRHGSVHYAGDTECETLSGFDAAPAGFLCAYKTTDDRKTLFQYKAGNLARVVQPGELFEDFSYDSLGRIIGYRDATANDAVAYGVRSNDASVMTEIGYDTSGKVTGVKAPAPTSSASRSEITLSYNSGAKTTVLNTTGASEPHGFSRKITYDHLLRTTTETDMSNLTTVTEWHPDRDLVYSITEPNGLKTTAIYDKDDLMTDTYGPVPASWLGTDRKPLAAHTTDTPHVRTGYDEGINGLAVAYYDNKKLLGAPKLNSTTTWDANEAVQTSFASGESPVTPTDGWSARYTGKVTLGATGTYTFKLRGDAGFRLFINDERVINGWGDGTLSGGNNTFTGTVNNTTANSTYRIRVDHYHGATGATDLQLYMTAPGQPETSVLSSILSPGYGLETSKTAFDSQLGDTKMANIYSNPAYGLLSKTILDPDGSAYEYTSTHEAPGTGFLRPTSNTLPGGGTVSYEYYGAHETRDNPCTAEVETFHQTGRQKLETETDPDGNGPLTGRTTETIYNEQGAVVATRYNDDPWTCTTYDERGRVTESHIPARDGKPGRIATNNYLVNNNPLISSTQDSSGTIIVENDLLGRTVKYTDARGNVTENVYDDITGNLTSRTSPVGVETFEYDQYDRMIVQKLDNVTYSTIAYDAYSRVESVDYPAGLRLSSIGYDVYHQENSTTYTLDDDSELTETLQRSISGNVISGNENGVTKTYEYNSIGNLTKATLGDQVFEYGFENSEGVCDSVPTSNYNAHKNGNRTWSKINGVRTDFCYDQADRLIWSSDQTLTNPEYDSHGNTLSLGSGTDKTSFTYDISDRNTSVSSGDKQTLYDRDVLDRIIKRQQKENSSVTGEVFYGYTGSEDTPDFTTDANGDVIQRYLTVAGDVIVTLDSTKENEEATTYSLPNMHGDVFATIDGNGAIINTHLTGPFGEKVTGQTAPTNTVEGTSFGYLGQYSRFTDTESSAVSGGIVQMGARVYVPALGRFLQVDPVEGGTENSYVYPTDPVNDMDVSGEFGFLIPVLIHVVRIAAPHVIRAVVKHTAKKVVKNVTKQVTKKVTKQVVKHTPRIVHKAVPKVVKVVSKPKSVAIKRPAPKKVSVPKTSNFKSNLKTGQKAHKEFGKQVKKAGGQSEYNIPGYGRADGLLSNRVLELKPDNARAIAQGLRQLSRYEKGTGLPGQLWTYRTTLLGKFKFACKIGC